MLSHSTRDKSSEPCLGSGRAGLKTAGNQVQLGFPICSSSDLGSIPR